MLLAAVQWTDGISSAWNDIAQFVPKLIGFLLILIIGYFIAKGLSKVIDKVLDRVGFDRAVERGGVAKAMSKSKYDPSDLVSKLVFYAIFLFVLQAAFGTFGPNPISDLLASVIAYLPKVFVAVIAIVITTAIAAAVREVIQSSLGGLSYGSTLANGVSIAIIAIGGFVALNQLEIAPAIVNGLFYTALAVIGGTLIISLGGGGIKPMQQRWEKAFAKYDEEKPKMQREMQGSKERIAQRSQQLKNQARNSR